MNIYHSPIPVLLVIIPLSAAFIIPVLGNFRKWISFYLALSALFTGLVISIMVMMKVLKEGVIRYYMGGWAPPWGIEYRIDHLSAMMVVLLFIIAFIVCIYSKRSILSECPEKKVHFYCLYLLLISGLVGIVVTGDMFNLYVFLEISSLSGYALIAIGDKEAPLMAFKYLIVGTIGACFYLLGVCYLYDMTGSLNMEDIAKILPEVIQSKAVLVALIFIVVGCSIKVALFPLHVWLPGAYSSAPSAVSTLIAPTMTKVSAYILIRIMFTVFDPEVSLKLIPINDILICLSSTAIIYGSIRAILQSDIKMMLAYSSVAQVGYIILGVSLGNAESYKGGVLHIVNHAVMKGCLFAVAGAIFYKHGLRKVEDFVGLHKKMPFTALVFIIASLSMIGIPPTAGFFSKWHLLMGSINANQWILVGIILISSLLNAVYFFKVIEYMCVKPKNTVPSENMGSDAAVFDEAPLSMLIPILMLGAGILILGFFSFFISEQIIAPSLPSGIL